MKKNIAILSTTRPEFMDAVRNATTDEEPTRYGFTFMEFELFNFFWVKDKESAKGLYLNEKIVSYSMADNMELIDFVNALIKI